MDRPTSFVLLAYEDDHYHYNLTLNFIDDRNSFEPLLARHDTEGNWTVFDARKNAGLPPTPAALKA